MLVVRYSSDKSVEIVARPIIMVRIEETGWKSYRQGTALRSRQLVEVLNISLASKSTVDKADVPSRLAPS